MKTYRHIFFDLDHTLWDFEQNSARTLEILHTKYALSAEGIAVQDFLATFHRVNHELWRQLNVGLIDKKELRISRFRKVFEALGKEEREAWQGINEEYIQTCPYGSAVMDGALDVLQYLASKYHLHIITNGFHEIQHIKLKSGRMDHFFKAVITSNESGHSKPHEAMFQYALEKAKAKPNESIMVGDDLIADVKGATDVGMSAIWYNPKKNHLPDFPVHVIHHLAELQDLL